jgi:hypothetical protein
MRVENPKLVVEPGAGRTGKLAMVAYQFQHIAIGVGCGGNAQHCVLEGAEQVGCRM